MGKTVPAYRIALEWEINTWKSFKKALHKEEEKEAFEALMDMCRNNAAASGNAVNPVIFEPMVMSILLAHQEKLQELECKLYDLLWLKTNSKAPEGHIQLKQQDKTKVVA